MQLTGLIPVPAINISDLEMRVIMPDRYFVRNSVSGRIAGNKKTVIYGNGSPEKKSDVITSSDY